MRYEVSLLPFAEEEIDSLAEDPTMWPTDSDAVRHYILRAANQQNISAR
jgi:hypothetical protein